MPALVRQFENNNEEYTKIIKTVEEKVNDTLSKGKDLLRLAFLSLTESMRKDPEKYRSLIYPNMPSTTHYSDPQYPPYGYGFYKNGQGQDQSRNYSKKDYIDMLVEEAHKLQDMLVKDIVDETLDDYRTHLRTSLPSLPPPDEDNV